MKKRTNDVKNQSKIQGKARLVQAAQSGVEQLFDQYGTGIKGLSTAQVRLSREKYGANVIARGQTQSLIQRIFEAFINPFTAILLVLALISAFTDVLWAAPGEADPMAVIIIVTMVIFSGLLRFIQNTKSENAAEKLLQLIKITTLVERQERGRQELALDEVVVGDLIHLAAGDMIPADLRIIRAKDLFVSQSALTGESEPLEKTASAVSADKTEKVTLSELTNLAFMGSNVISGSATGLVIATGEATLFGQMAEQVSEKPVQTSFEKGVNSVSWLIIRFMLVMVPVVLFVNGLTKGDWLEALLFALSVAVGLTPEMLPMIVTACLAKGAVTMSKEKTIIKNLNAIQNLGGMDILCTDKTGTLTQDKVVLEHYLDIHGDPDSRVLRHAFLNSYYQTGLKNLMDHAIIARTFAEQEHCPELAGLDQKFEKVDEIPFDFERRRMSVVIESGGKRQMITKGAVEEMLSICSYAEYRGQVQALTGEIKAYIQEKVAALNENGLRVIALAQKTNPSCVGEFSVADESEMVLMGYMAFMDPPKSSTAAAIKALSAHGVSVKVLTGDNEKVTQYICQQVGLEVTGLMLGSALTELSDQALSQVVEEVNVFAKLSPQQKARIITALRANGHSVGYMGDGINDAAGLKKADVGISVDTAVDVSKAAADVILLEKDLMVLEKAIIEGRKTYANMIKYIKMTASSNFGNMFSVLAASAFLPFLPMLPVHILLLNLIYDLSCAAIPWDKVDEDYLRIPRKWDAGSIGKFMLWFGPTSSIFDLTTYLLLYFVICPAAVGGVAFSQLTDPGLVTYFIALFHAGWFVESMWTQTLVIHMLRTPKLPFLRSRASWPVMGLTFAGIAVLTLIPFTAFGQGIGLAALPATFFPWLILTVFCYMVLVTVFKKIFVSKYGELL